jgi:hypothetical protein
MENEADRSILVYIQWLKYIIEMVNPILRLYPAVAIMGFAAVLVFPSALPSYAHGTGESPPPECLPWVGAATVSVDHSLAILNGDGIQPGDDVTAEAAVNSGSLVSQVRFLWYDASDTLVRQNVVPKAVVGNPWAVQDTFEGVYGPNTEWHVVACYEGAGKTHAINIYHIDLASFFVLPEAAIGTIALVGASLAAYGGFTTLRNRNNKNV